VEQSPGQRSFTRIANAAKRCPLPVQMDSGKRLGLALAVLALSVLPATALAAESPIGHPEAAQVENFSIFRTVPEQLPSGAPANEIDGNPGLHFNGSLAQKAKPSSGPVIWVVPGRRHIRLLEPLRTSRWWGTTWSSTTEAIKRGLSMSVEERRPSAGSSAALHRSHDYRAMGLVPDGVVAVRLAKGVVAKVQNNVYSRSVEQSTTPDPVFIWSR
jgi:hypothetical protein